LFFLHFNHLILLWESDINDIINECSLAWKVRYVRNRLIHGNETWPMKTEHDALKLEQKLVTEDWYELKMKQMKN